MSIRALIPAAVALALTVLVLAAACGDDDDSDELLPTAEPTTAVDGAPTSPDIRQEDLSQQPGLQTFLAEAGGEFVADDVTYADLTGDGSEEAVVPVSSSGEGGDIAVFVYGYVAGELQELLRALPEGESRSVMAELQGGALAVSEPVYGPDDPLCCPSQLRVRTYSWDGSSFTVDETVEEDPSQKDRYID